MVQYYSDLHALETGSLPLVKSVANMFADVIYKNKDRLMAGVIVAGWDKKVGLRSYHIMYLRFHSKSSLDRMGEVYIPYQLVVH